MGRIKGESVKINDKEVKQFFSNRVKKDLPYRYNYTNYQDANPELVLLRDKCEKDKIVPLLKKEDNITVLDIGCGVGRWGDLFLEKKGCKYIGVDYCEEILRIAEKHFADRENITFIHSSFQNLPNALRTTEVNDLFDLIIINGVMMYINDDDICSCLFGIKDFVKLGGVVYVKESVGKEFRLTLADIYSEELSSNYSAIYRSVEEYNALWNDCWAEWKIYNQGELWDEEIQKRSDTSTYYWLFKK